MNLQCLLQVLVRRSCVFCGAGCAAQMPHICAGCLDDLPWRARLVARHEAPFEVMAAIFDYAFPIDAALKALKFRRRLDYVPAFATLLARAMRELPDDIDALLPVPLHWRRHLQRGYNQAVELSRALHSLTGLPMLCNIRRCRATPYQSGLAAEARSANLRAAFAAQATVPSRHVLIVDDVITTGSTCRELANSALAAGAKKVSVLAVART
ncbi:MAG: ComF family protein [Gammaproteobacteria bacterium]|nr:ComF family protein [Gammaproteobacteria bacterium]